MKPQTLSSVRTYKRAALRVRAFQRLGARVGVRRASASASASVSWIDKETHEDGYAIWKYPDELRLRALRLYRESNPKPVIRRLAEQLGVHPEALRNWIRQDEADRGSVTTGRPRT